MPRSEVLCESCLLVLSLVLLTGANASFAQAVQTWYDHGTSFTNSLYGPPRG